MRGDDGEERSPEIPRDLPVIEAVVAGESFVVTRNGVPVAEVRPIRTARRTFVPKAELVALASAGPHIDGDLFRADLDRVVDQGL